MGAPRAAPLRVECILGTHSPTMFRTSRLVTVWLGAVLLFVALPAALVVYVDPFGYFGTNTAGYYYSSERQFKQHLVRAADYNALVLGDSRIAYTDTRLVNLTGYTFVNGGIGGGTLNDAMSLLATAKIDALHLVVIGFAATAFMGADSCRIEAVHETPWFEPIRFAASWTQLWFSIAVLYNNYIGAQPYYHRDGTRIGAWNLVDHAQATQRTARYWRGVDK